MSSVKQLRQPFVLTLSVAALACGGEVVVYSSSGVGGSNSAGSTGSTGSGNTSSGSGNTSSVTSTGVTSGGGSVPITCPADAPTGYDACTLEDEGVCTYTIACQSGAVEMGFTCTPGEYGWRVVTPGACDQAYDSCPGTELYCDGAWWMPQGTNPPSPCPEPRPMEGTACWPGGMGGVHQNCGYLCENDESVWTVATCSGSFEEEGVWEYDSACAP